MGERLYMPVIDETTANSIIIEWTQYADAADRSVKGDPVKIRKILDSLSKQTSRGFKIEKRPVEVWFLTAGLDSGPVGGGGDQAGSFPGDPEENRPPTSAATRVNARRVGVGAIAGVIH